MLSQETKPLWWVPSATARVLGVGDLGAAEVERPVDAHARRRPLVRAPGSVPQDELARRDEDQFERQLRRRA